MVVRGDINPSGTPADRRAREVPEWLIVGLVIVNFLLVTAAFAVGGIVLVNVQSATNRVSGVVDGLNDERVRSDQVDTGQCERLQRERERLNVVEATIYRTLDTAAQTSNNPTARRDFNQQAKAAAWSPPVNCARANDDPLGYQPPEPVPFSELPESYPQRIIDAAAAGDPQPPPRPGP